MSHQLPEQVEVLVVGAGPTGLAVALSLDKHGCKDLLVVDSVLAGDNSSRAIVVHAATLEALDEVGCAEDLTAAGIKATNAKLWNGRRFHSIGDFSVLKQHTKFPFLLLVPQRVTERVLSYGVKKAGINVIRPLKVVDIRINAASPDLTDVIFDDGRVTRARYVVGADGARSIVRSIAGISYKDPDGEDVVDDEVKQAVIADVTFKTPPPSSTTEGLFLLSNGNFFICLPLPPAEYGGEQAWRIAIGIPVGVPPHAPPTEYLQGLVDQFGPGTIPLSALPNNEPLKIAKTIWSTRFRTDSAVTSTPFTRLRSRDGKVTGGVVILIGDAAHKHPPAGGQGMNLGLRDAVFLGPVLTAHIKTAVTEATSTAQLVDIDKPLQAWADVRHERALQIIALAKRILSIASWRNEMTWYIGVIPINWVSVRNLVMWLGDVTGKMQKVVPWQLSGLLNR